MSDSEGGQHGNSLNKVETDVERHLLETTVCLSDGTEGLIFSRGPKNESNLFLYNCHLCGVPNLPGERCLQTHISGRKHQRRLTETDIDATIFRAPLTKTKFNMSIAPGEPVPPGFEDEVRITPELQPFLDGYKANSVIGLEYVVELNKPEDNEPGYLCLLCDKRGDPRTIIAHITSYNHRLKYLEKHFPSVVKEIVPYRYNSEARNLMPRLIQTICEAIEDHHGRLTLSVFNYADFHKNRNKILQDIIRDRHFDEKNGPNFVNVIDKKALDEKLKAGKKSIAISLDAIRRRDSSPVNRAVKRDKDGSVLRRSRDNLDAISSDSDSPLRQRSPKYRPNTFRRSRSRSVDRFGKRKRRSRTLSLSLSPLYRGGAPPRVHRSPPFDKRDPVKPARSAAALSKQASEITQDKYKKEKFRALVDNAIKELEKNLKEHEKNPEKHPLYPDEWKKFWNRRYKELQAEKKDPNKYDYKPEWIVFWTKRMKELHADEIEKKKSEIRKQVGLKDSPTNRAATKDKLEVIDISDEETSPLSVSPVRSDYERREKKSSSRYRDSRERHRERIPEPHPDYYHGSSSRDYHASMSLSHISRYGVRYMGPESYPQYEPEQKEEEEVDDGPLTVVAVLRLLTALEDQLGSLGPKIIDLLAKALALEKIKANSADEMLLNDDTSVFFETVKEKLKGQILAGVLDSNKIRAVKKAVKNIAAILHQVTENAKEKPKDEAPEPEDAAKLKLLKTEILDRHLISSKLAAALVINEKTDVSKEDMDRLINVFILMVKLSKERSSNVEVKDILLELGIETQIFENDDDILSNISKVDSKESSEVVPANPTNSLESLTDSDLQTLLQNFKHLSSEEQHHLIAHLKKLESSDPLRVEKLRKFVDITELKKEKSSSPPRIEVKSFAKTSKGNFSDEEFEQKDSVMDSDEDDDYNFDDVVKAASNNLKDGSNKEERLRSSSVSRDRDGEISNMSMGSAASATNISLSNTKNLIDNLLGSLQKTNRAQANPKTSTIPTIGSGTTNPRVPTQNSNNFYQQSQSATVAYPQQQQQQQHLIPQQPINMFDNNYYPNNNMQQVGGQYNNEVAYPFNQYQRQQPNMPSGNFINPQQQQQQQPNFLNQMQNPGNYF